MVRAQFAGLTSHYRGARTGAFRNDVEKTDIIARVHDLPERGFDGFLAWVLNMHRELGIPHSLAEIGVCADKAMIIGREAIDSAVEHYTANLQQLMSARAGAYPFADLTASRV
jgi:hypothetical protein